MTNDTILLHLSLLEGIGPRVVDKLLQDTTFPLQDIYLLSASELMLRFNFSESMAQRLAEGLTDAAVLEREINLIQKHNVGWITIANPEYPVLLKNIHLPPTVLYWLGEPLAHQEKTIAFVGARIANEYAQRCISAIVPDLVEQGWCIVSGGALGADGMAHQATLANGGRTVAVLGSGLLRLYPAEHKTLFAHIAKFGGTLVSSFPLAMASQPGNFPARNRIISGLSYGTVVVQAAEKSGALITAHYALEQGREVFAVPGSIEDLLSAGCHNLLREGAKLVSSASDITQEFEHLAQMQPTLVIKQAPEIQLEIAPKQMPNRAKKELEIPQDTSPKGRVMTHCVRPCSIDELIQMTGLEQSELNMLLFELQLAGQIRQNFAGMWERISV